MTRPISPATWPMSWARLRISRASWARAAGDAIAYFPVGVETRQFARLAQRARKTELVKKVMGSIPGALMIGVDRLDYSKGIHPRLEAYERFLAANPEWHGKITYLQITPKSRSQIRE